MKTMTCKQLGGACDLEFIANTFEEMSKMQNLMKTQSAFIEWMVLKRKEFDLLPDIY